MKRLILIVLVVFLGASYFLKGSSLPLIGVTQIVDHASLDEEREGMIASLKELGFIDGKTVNIRYHSAQGNIAMASQIVNQFSSDGAKVIVAISTPSAQAALPICTKSGIPLVFSAVSNPKQIIPDTSSPRKENITGITDAFPAKMQLDLIRAFYPSVKKIGLLYNSGESNSVKQAEDFKKTAEKMELQVLEGIATKTSDVALAVRSLLSKVDVFYVPNDNTFVSSMVQVVGLAEKTPVFAGDTGSVQNGALAANGINRIFSGRNLGGIVGRILKGEEASTMPILGKQPMEILVNAKTLKTLELTIPKELEGHVKIIQEVSTATVGITSIVQHPSLAKIERGIKDTLTENKIAYVSENANGAINMANVIAQKFSAKGYEVLVPITTSSTVAMYNVASKRKTPLVFAGVSDSNRLSLQPGDIVSGVCDFPPLSEQVNLIKKISELQKNTKVGILYNASEANSESIVSALKPILQENNLSFSEKTVTSITEISSALKSLFSEGVGIIYLPLDNTVISAVSVIIEACKNQTIPIICSDPESVEKGCLACVSFDQYDIGVEAGKLILEYLKTQKMPPVKHMGKTVNIMNAHTYHDLYGDRGIDNFNQGDHKFTFVGK